MSDESDRIFEIFKRPWKIKHPTCGNYFVQDKEGRVSCWVCPQGTDIQNHWKPTEEKALMIVQSIAKMSKRK